MKLKDGFVTHETEKEQIMVGAGTGFSGLVKSNKTAAFIIDCLKAEVTEEEIVAKMLEKYNAEKNQVAADVKMVLDNLRKIGALDE